MNPVRPVSFLLALWIVVGAAHAHAGELRVRLVGVTDAVGSVRAALFTSGADFEAGKQAAGHFTRAAAGPIEIVFAGLEPGRYGISAFHDVNANDDLDTNLLGMPTEPFGFSRNARGRFGPPTFDDLAVEVGDDVTVLEVELQ